MIEIFEENRAERACFYERPLLSGGHDAVDESCLRVDRDAELFAPVCEGGTADARSAWPWCFLDRLDRAIHSNDLPRSEVHIDGEAHAPFGAHIVLLLDALVGFSFSVLGQDDFLYTPEIVRDVVYFVLLYYK